MTNVKLTNPIADPWTHVEFPALDEQGVQQKDENDNPIWQEFHAGDVINCSDETAEHLVMSHQGEILDNQQQPVLDNQGLPTDQG